MILHSGTADVGHYIAVVQDNNGFWMCNDSIITNINKINQSIPNFDIYVCLYHRQN